MLSEKIKELRKKGTFSQEELALKLHIVRQTVSKWENGLSVPDAMQLIELAKIFEVSVSELLDTEIKDETNTTQIAEQLEKANAQIAELLEKERNWKEASRVRGSILLLTFLAMFVTMVVKNEIAALIGTGILMVSTLVILYRNLGVMTVITTKDIRLKALKITTLFNIGMIVFIVAAAVFMQADIISIGEKQEEYFAASVMIVVLFFIGYISPKLPFNRHTGLRLPWTVQDEETWNVAHQILGIISVPLGIVCLILLLFVEEFETLIMGIMLLDIGIPGVLSWLYYRKKFFGRSWW